MKKVVDIGIDLGTASVIIAGKGKGILLQEPALVAVDREKRTLIAVGDDAQKLLGRAPASIRVYRPMGDGTVTDPEMLSAMLRYLIGKVRKKSLFSRPRMLITFPGTVNDQEIRVIKASLFEAGARRIDMLERPVAAAIGARLPMRDSHSRMICDIGGAVTDICVLSQGQVVVRDTVNIGGSTFDSAITRYIHRRHNMMIGEITAAEIKENIGSAIPRREQFYMDVPGRSLLTGLPRYMRVTSDEVTDALDDTLQLLMEKIHNVLEHTPPEAVADICDSEMILTGGGARLSGLAQRITQSLKINCRLAEDAQLSAAKGCAIALENWNEYGLYRITRRRKAISAGADD